MKIPRLRRCHRFGMHPLPEMLGPPDGPMVNGCLPSEAMYQKSIVRGETLHERLTRWMEHATRFGIIRNGMDLDLLNPSRGAEILRFDRSERVSVTIFSNDIPLGVFNPLLRTSMGTIRPIRRKYE